MNILESDIVFLKRAVDLAYQAEALDNLPIGAVIVLGGRIIAEGQNAIWFPSFNQNRHAEIEALRAVPKNLWDASAEMTLYTTLEPCLMCLAAILLHKIGRVVYGSHDPYGGASMVRGHMPAFFEEQISKTEWIGPGYPQKCDKLYQRIKELENLV